MERVLITGAAGFAAGHLIEWLLGQGAAVLGTDRLDQWTKNSPPPSALRDVELLPWNLSQSEGLSDSAFQRIADFRPTYMFHLAALSVPKLCGLSEMTDSAYQVNVAGTRRVIELAERLQSAAETESGRSLAKGSAYRPRLIFISSSHVYGSSRPADTATCSEETPVCCQNGYAQSKYLAEQEILSAVREGRIDGMVIRAFQHTGPRQTGELMLPEWLNQIVGGARALKIHSKRIWVDLTDVRDMARGYWQVAKQGKSGRIYNLGGGNQLTCADILKELFSVCGQEYPVIETKPGEKYSPMADCRNLRLDGIDWQPKLPLRQTLFDSFVSWKSFVSTSN